MASVVTYPVILAGDVTVGKTSLWCALQNLPIPEEPSNTPAQRPTEFDYRVTLRDGTVVTLRVVDTGGAERYNTFTVHRYQYGSAIVFVYAIDNTDSFQDIPDWVSESHRHGWLQSGFASFLVGNKTDKDRAVYTRFQRQLVARLQLSEGFETSAKDSPRYVQQVFDTIAETVHARFTTFHGSAAVHLLK